jgi:hypothetical protein
MVVLHGARRSVGRSHFRVFLIRKPVRLNPDAKSRSLLIVFLVCAACDNFFSSRLFAVSLLLPHEHTYNDVLLYHSQHQFMLRLHILWSQFQSTSTIETTSTGSNTQHPKQ